MFTIFCMLLVIIGAINWFSVGVFDFNIINWIFTEPYYLGARIVYGIVGVAGLWLIVYLIYNKFSSRRLNTIENGIRKNIRMNDNTARNIEAGNIEVPSSEENHDENHTDSDFEEFD